MNVSSSERDRVIATVADMEHATVRFWTTFGEGDIQVCIFRQYFLHITNSTCAGLPVDKETNDWGDAVAEYSEGEIESLGFFETTPSTRQLTIVEIQQFISTSLLNGHRLTITLNNNIRGESDFWHGQAIWGLDQKYLYVTNSLSRLEWAHVADQLFTEREFLIRASDCLYHCRQLADEDIETLPFSDLERSFAVKEQILSWRRNIVDIARKPSAEFDWKNFVSYSSLLSGQFIRVPYYGRPGFRVFRRRSAQPSSCTASSQEGSQLGSSLYSSLAKASWEEEDNDDGTDASP